MAQLAAWPVSSGGLTDKCTIISPKLAIKKQFKKGDWQWQKNTLERQQQPFYFALYIKYHTTKNKLNKQTKLLKIVRTKRAEQLQGLLCFKSVVGKIKERGGEDIDIHIKGKKKKKKCKY